MANVKKCDICGKLYESPICNDAVRNVIHLDLGYMGDRYVELCNDCYKPTLLEGYSVDRQKVRDNE